MKNSKKIRAKKHPDKSLVLEIIRVKASLELNKLMSSEPEAGATAEGGLPLRA